MQQLLRGIRIIDLTSVVLGPYATQILGDLGAEVIKIEPPDGDVFRAVRPGRSASMGAGFLNCNRNKQSIAIDLKRTEGRELLHDLVRSHDVLVHNMRPASAQKLGLSYTELRSFNDSLVYCYAPGFGQEGMHSASPAYDDIIQSMSGLALLNADDSGEPRFLPTIVCDKVAGLHLALAVLAGVVRRLMTGSGSCTEVPMFESMVSFLMLEQLAGATFIPPLGGMGYERLQSRYRRPFRSKDGYVSILPYTTKHWRSYLELIERSSAPEAQWVSSPVTRSARIDELYRIISEATPARTTAEWLKVLREHDIPCAALNSVSDLLHEPHLLEAGFFPRSTHPTQGTVRSVRSPFFVHDTLPVADLPAPELGADTLRILKRAGVSGERIDSLLAQRVIYSPSEGRRP